MDARSVGVGAMAMQRSASGAQQQQQQQQRAGRRNLDLITAGNYTWCPELDYLADGVTSSVYRCRDRVSGDFYAVKVFKGKPPAREVELLRKLKHDNIVRLIIGISFADHQGNEKTGLVLEYCSGNSLHEYLKKPDNKLGLNDSDFLSLLYNMCDGLAYLREKLKIVHRDIKPGNIMISYNNRHEPVFKLADFGSSRELEDGGDFESLVGTYEFLHPSIYMEVHNRMCHVKQGAPAAGHKPECDLWSLGVTLYMAAAGRLPFSPFEGVRNNHAQMIDMMVKKPPQAISATQDSLNGPIIYHTSLPATSLLSGRLQTLLVTLLQGILACDFKEQWTFAKFFDTVNQQQSQRPTYYFVAGAMLRPDLVFSAKQTLDSLLTSLAAATGFARDEIVVFYRSQAVTAFPTGTTHACPLIVLSKHRFACTLDIASLDFDFVNYRPRNPDASQPKEVKDYVDEAHRQGLACRHLAKTCHLNHSLTLEAKDATLSLLRTRGREAYQRVSAKVAMVSSSQQKVGRLMELARLVRAQTGSQSLNDDMRDWQRVMDRVDTELRDYRSEGRGGGGGGHVIVSMDGASSGSLVPADDLAARFNQLFERLPAPRVSAECLSAAFHRMEQVHDRYTHMIHKFMSKDAQRLADLMRNCFVSDRTLLDRCLDESQAAIRTCCVETLTSVRGGLASWMAAVQEEVTRLGKMEELCPMQDVEADLDLLHDKVFRSIHDALVEYFKMRKASSETDIMTLSKSIQDLIRSTDLVQGELQRNADIMKELDQLSLKNSGLSSLESQASGNTSA